MTVSTQCSGYYDGNDSNQDLNGLFGTDWTEAAKINIVDADENGFSDTDGPFVNGILTIDGPSTTDAGLSGTWSVTGWSGFTKAMIVIKAGNSFSAYLMDLAYKSGTWSTAGVDCVGNSCNQPGLSHFTLYKVTGDSGTGGDGGEVPLPAAAWFLLTGVAGLGAMRRLRKAA